MSESESFDLDKFIEKLMDCKHLTDNELKFLIEKVGKTIEYRQKKFYPEKVMFSM